MKTPVTPLRQLLLLLALLLLARLAAHAQGGVGIGTTAPDASAALDIVSTSKGLLLPRLTQAARLALPAPAPGLIVYQTDGAQPGFWYASGSPATWTRLTDQASGGGPYVQAQTSTDQAAGFRLTGVGNVGQLGVGTSAPAVPAHVVGNTDELLRLESGPT